jgi:PncC family amidohydrolase
MIASSITAVPGSSNCFKEGFVTYSNEAKIKNLGVLAETIDRYGVVSANVAGEMAQGVLARTSADFSLSVTGVAGPDGGTVETPVGRVYIGCAFGFEVRVIERTYKGDRHEVRQQTVVDAFQLLESCMDYYEGINESNSRK